MTLFPSRLTTKDGLLYWDGKMLNCPAADSIAYAYGYMCAERLVAALEAAKPSTPKSQ